MQPSKSTHRQVRSNRSLIDKPRDLTSQGRLEAFECNQSIITSQWKPLQYRIRWPRKDKAYRATHTNPHSHNHIQGPIIRQQGTSSCKRIEKNSCMRVHSTFQFHRTNFQGSFCLLGKPSSLLVFPELPHNLDSPQQFCRLERHRLDRDCQSQLDRRNYTTSVGQDFILQDILFCTGFY